MSQVLILGAQGMLGHKIFQVALEKHFQVFGTVRKRGALSADSTFMHFDAEEDICQLDEISLTPGDWIINCIGLIGQKHDLNQMRNVKNSIAINSTFPLRLAEYAMRRDLRVIQIATDCVYSGRKSKYLEKDQHDALDVYGKTKSLGEPHSDNVLNLRTSIVGPEQTGHYSLFEWFRNLPHESEVSGFSNHLWNGVTTEAFAKVALGIVESGDLISGIQHLIPADSLSKHELLMLFAQKLGRQDIRISAKHTEIPINRILDTGNPETNRKLWALGGYDSPPTIKELVTEMRL